MRPLRLLFSAPAPARAPFVLLLWPLAGCPDTYSQDPKVAAAYAGAAAGLAVAQAVAESHTPDAPVADSIGGHSKSLPSLRSYALQAINRIRADHSLPALTPSASLNEFAQRGSEWLEEDHQPRHHLLSDARCAHCGENQGNVEGEPAGLAEVQIDKALARMMKDEADPRANLLSTSWRFVGIGITNPGAAMFLTMDFADVAF
jgi:uncharacterized protein YkwD